MSGFAGAMRTAFHSRKTVFKSLRGRREEAIRLFTTEAQEKAQSPPPPPSPRPKPRVWPFYFIFGAAVGSGLYILGRTDDPEQAKLSYPRRVWNKAVSLFTSFDEPAFEKLLPDAVMDPQHPRPYTLVVDLDKFLVCHIWDREQGRWRIAKRPGAELFLFYAAQLYEVVVFSSLPQHEGDAIVKKLDPYGCISYSLYRFACTHRRGTYLKDIAHLNRDLSKVLVLGHDEVGFSLQPENFIRMSPWVGETNDLALEQVVDFLEMLAFSRLKDIRPFTAQFRGKAFPETFEENQRQAFNAVRESQNSSIQGRLAKFFSFGSGHRSSSLSDGASSSSSYDDKKAERIELRRKEYSRIKELMQKQLEAELQREKEYYAEHKMSLWDMFSRGPPPPPSPPPPASSPVS